MSTSPPRSLKILVHALDAIGHLNSCVGIAQALTARGHTVRFLLNAKFAGQYSKYGFEEVLLATKPPEIADKKSDDPEESPVKRRAKAILDSGLLSGKSSLEKMKHSVEIADGFGQQIYNVAVDFNPQIGAAIQKYSPDLFILDHFIVYPALLEAKIPWVKLYSSNPMGLYYSKELPPSESGYPTSGDRTAWEEFRSYSAEFAKRFNKYQVKLFEHFNYPYTEANLPRPGTCTPRTPFGYIYGYPRELDYDDLVGQLDPEKYIRVDAFCRVEAEDPEFQIPEDFLPAPGRKLIYFSLGSVGAFDVPLVQKIAGFLSKTSHRIIVSKGPLADEYELPPNCWGMANLPQTRILPLVDLVVSHGGNNTVTEAFSFGKPLIILPLFAEQGDNGQRIVEKKFGARLNPYEMTEREFLRAVQEVLEDEEMKTRLEAAKVRIQAENSKKKACEKLEKIVENFVGGKIN